MIVAAFSSREEWSHQSSLTFQNASPSHIVLATNAVPCHTFMFVTIRFAAIPALSVLLIDAPDDRQSSARFAVRVRMRF
jgi:hypothetical protein